MYEKLKFTFYTLWKTRHLRSFPFGPAAANLSVFQGQHWRPTYVFVVWNIEISKKRRILINPRIIDPYRSGRSLNQYRFHRAILGNRKGISVTKMGMPSNHKLKGMKYRNDSATRQWGCWSQHPRVSETDRGPPYSRRRHTRDFRVKHRRKILWRRKCQINHSREKLIKNRPLPIFTWKWKGFYFRTTKWEFRKLFSREKVGEDTSGGRGVVLGGGVKESNFCLKLMVPPKKATAAPLQQRWWQQGNSGKAFRESKAALNQ